MKCKNCGKELSDDVSFCIYCGTPQHDEAAPTERQPQTTVDAPTPDETTDQDVDQHTNQQETHERSVAEADSDTSPAPKTPPAPKNGRRGVRAVIGIACFAFIIGVVALSLGGIIPRGEGTGTAVQQEISVKGRLVWGGKDLSTAASKEIKGLSFKVTDTGNVQISGKNKEEGQASFVMADKNASDVTLESGAYYICGCPDGGGSQTFRMWINSADDTVKLYETGKGAYFTLTKEQSVTISIDVQPGVDASGITFAPAIYKLGDK